MSEETKGTGRPDEDLLFDLNFVPQWAKKAPGVNHYGPGDSQRERSGRAPRGDGPVRRARFPERAAGGHSPARAALPVARQARPVEGPRVERKMLPVEIRFLPDQKMLSSMVRQIHHAKRAYPLIDLAALFLNDMKGHLVKIEVRPDAGSFILYQGHTSKMVATSRDVLLGQMIENHLEDFFDREEVETGPPSGSFPLIAKVDHVVIGPPNHHSYADRLLEIHRTRYAHLPFDRFKERVQTVRDEEMTEQWKQEASRKTIFRLKGSEEGGREFSLAQAEEHIRTHLAGSEIEEVTRAVLPGSLARAIRDENLLRMVRDAFERESRFPQSLSFALRAAFRHLHLHLFKAGGNINFVTAVKPDPIRPEAAVEGIRSILEFLAEHPGSTREQLVSGLRPGVTHDSEAAHEILNPIRWLVEKGHLIEFFNGTLSVPAHRKRDRSTKPA